MDNAQTRARKIFREAKNNPVPGEFIKPVDEPKFKIVESFFSGDLQRDFAIVTSDTAYGPKVVLEYVAYKSGLPDDWVIVPGYPYLNEDKEIEWKLVRWKDW